MFNSKSNLISYNLIDRLNSDVHTRNYINQRLGTPKPSANIEESWIYALCMRCRVEDNTTSWEPKFWQKLCPYPLCPSYRQFANFLAIVVIGEYFLKLTVSTKICKKNLFMISLLFQVLLYG